MRICSGAGCLRKIADGIRFCDECKPASPVDDGIRNHTSGYDAELDRLRNTPRWRRTRARVVQRQPFCKRCDVAVTEIVDHIVPAREAISQTRVAMYNLDRNAGYFLESNLQGLCRSCHGLKTLEDKAHVGPWPDVVAIERAKFRRTFSF